MALKNSEKGFTLLNQLFSLLILIICIPIQGAILNTLHHQNTYYEELSIQQFFNFIQREVNQSIACTTHSNKIVLHLYNDDVVTIELYRQLVRRQLNGKGHEIYLRDIESFQISSLPFGFTIHVTSLKGDHYEKTIGFCP
ncbi:ComGF family competence protein [Ornithinibacillus sp. BX22]|uniref:ComGF family competence protein n=2 Tax=Ornithinibacillus TaxID=484508 RepID=A0A923L634_9BACI|nr:MULTISPECIES: competence type IV pilus minor pilin ComGF [Ornithinibacillus]MBC5637203.1 ComGF family competence protein [Ornithinibacillus hominis]MBS3679586.1 ComGF family competence protein [Ornithinibacillus massiliensis]